MAEQMQYTPRPWRVVEKGRGRYMRGYDAAADEAERLKTDLAAARAEARWWRKRATSDKVALIRGPWYGPYEYLYVDAQRIAACVHACDGIPTQALEAGVIRDLIKAATQYLQITTRDTDDDDPDDHWFKEEFTRAWLSEVLAKVRSEES